MGYSSQAHHGPGLGEAHCFCAFSVFSVFFLFFFLEFIYLFLESGKEREGEGEKHQCVIASCMPPTGDLVHNPNMCPDWE